MATPAHKTDGISTSNGFSTGSISWSGLGYVSVASAAAGGGTVDGHSVSGGGVTWTSKGSIAYGDRRRLQVFESSAVPSTGALTITATVTGTYQETQWSADEVVDFNEATPSDASQSTTTNSVNTLSTPDLGTIDTDDIAFVASGFEKANDNFRAATGTTQLALRTAGGNVRSFFTGYSTTDDTPGVAWDTIDTSNCAVLGFIVNHGTGGGGGGGTILPQMMMNH